MLQRLLAFVIWAAVAAGAVFWLLRLAAGAPRVPSQATTVGFAPVGRGDWSPVLGAGATAPTTDDDEPEADEALASRFRLIGVVAPRSPRQREGVALISIDDGPAKAFRVGAAVDGATVLQSVTGFGASLGPLGGPAEVRLELPALPPPSTGTLPPPGAVGGAMPAPARPPMLRPPGLPAVRPGVAPTAPLPVPQGAEEALPDTGDGRDAS